MTDRSQPFYIPARRPQIGCLHRLAAAALAGYDLEQPRTEPPFPTDVRFRLRQWRSDDLRAIEDATRDPSIPMTTSALFLVYSRRCDEDVLGNRSST